MFQIFTNTRGNNCHGGSPSHFQEFFGCGIRALNFPLTNLKNCLFQKPMSCMHKPAPFLILFIISGKLTPEKLENKTCKLFSVVHGYSEKTVSSITWYYSLPLSLIYLDPLHVAQSFQQWQSPNQIFLCFKVLSSPLHPYSLPSHILELISMFNQIAPLQEVQWLRVLSRDLHILREVNGFLTGRIQKLSQNKLFFKSQRQRGSPGTSKFPYLPYAYSTPFLLSFNLLSSNRLGEVVLEIHTCLLVILLNNKLPQNLG